MNDDSDEEIITPSHRKAKSEAIDILDKFFDAYILVVLVESEDTHHTAVETAYKGGVDMSIGMAERIKHQLLNR